MARTVYGHGERHPSKICPLPEAFLSAQQRHIKSQLRVVLKKFFGSSMQIKDAISW
jgi:hypothetical protein